jgi:beta-lactamase superfamily II metal-dependent hydrolase
MVPDFLRIEMGRALHGDSLFVEWGGVNGKHRMLIDGGPIGAYGALESRIAALASEERQFELIVLSHVDTDHIEGVVRLFAEPLDQWQFQVTDVWFNGWGHLDDVCTLGGRQGEFFSALLQHRLKPGAWNSAFKGAVVVPPSGPLPVVGLAGGMKITLLSPTRHKLDKMREAWRKDLKSTGIKPGDIDAAWQELSKKKQYLPDQGLLNSSDSSIATILARQFKADSAAANGSSIAFLAEHAGGSCLFLADAHPDVLIDSLGRLLQERGEKRLKVDAVKVAHHGSKNNTDSELLSLIDSPRYLFSTSGAVFKHPDEEVVARILDAAGGRPVTLYFNYLSEFNLKWKSLDLQEKHNYSAIYNDEADGPLLVTFD